MDDWRLDTTTHALMLAPPPWPARLHQRGAAVTVTTLPGRTKPVGQWLADHVDVDIVFDTRLDARSFEAHYRGPPLFARDATVDASPAGIASLVLRASKDDATQWASRLGATLRPAVTAPDLSRSQREAIQMALALGYYDVPRRIELRSLAARLGTTHSSLSELLRRGERLIIAGHCDQSLVGHLSAPSPDHGRAAAR